jgi:hypothetical protein
MTILYFENDSKRINTLEEIYIMNATTCDHKLNIIQNNSLRYKILQLFHDETATEQINAEDPRIGGDRPTLCNTEY